MKRVILILLALASLALGGCAGQSTRPPSCGGYGYSDSHGNHVGSQRWADMNFIHSPYSTVRVHVLPKLLEEPALPPGVEYADYLHTQHRRIEAPGLVQVTARNGDSFWQTRMKGCDIDFDVIIPYRTQSYSAPRADINVIFIFYDVSYVGEERFVTVPLSAIKRSGFWDIYPRGYSY